MAIISANFDRYKRALEQLPAPGKGLGCHASLLGVSNLGVIAGIDSDKLFDDIRRHIPQGARRIPDREIWDAINKALADHSASKFTPKPRPAPIVQDGKAALQRIIEQSKISDEADLWELSPVRLLEAV